jgi:hypothetical protein
MVGNTCTIELITMSYKGSLSKLYTSVKVSVVVIGNYHLGSRKLLSQR